MSHPKNSNFLFGSSLRVRSLGSERLYGEPLENSHALSFAKRKRRSNLLALTSLQTQSKEILRGWGSVGQNQPQRHAKLSLAMTTKCSEATKERENGVLNQEFGMTHVVLCPSFLL
jgi:hypothetical protein